MPSRQRQALITHLGEFLSAQRRARMEAVLERRTRYVTLALEDIYQGHNASAVLRSAECFGIQDVHIVESRNAYQVHRDIALGASQWLDLHRYDDAAAGGALAGCCSELAERGYRLVAATPRSTATELPELDIESGKLAVVLGTEEEGLSSEALERSDEQVVVPLSGFTQSLNVSVCAALILRELTARLRQSELDWQLTAEEKDEIRLTWYRRSVKGSDLIERRFLDDLQAE